MRKASIDARFYLKEPSSLSPTLIYLRVNGGNYSIRLKYSTGLKVHPADWDANTQRAVTRSKSLQDRQAIRDLNLQIERYDMAVKEIVSNCTISGQAITEEVLKERLNNKPELHPTGRKNVKPVANQPETLIEFTSLFIEEALTGKRLIPESGKRYETNTLRAFSTSLRHLEAFTRTTRYQLTFDAISERFYRQFTTYLTAANLGQNSIGKIIKNIKTLLTLAYKEGYHQNRAFESFKKPKETTTAVYLTSTDLETLYHLDLTQNSRLERVRDLFLVGCYTGLRFSDWNKVLPENLKQINGQTVLRIRPTKTDIPVAVPVRSELAAILSKYEGLLPSIPSNQKTNEYLKEVMQLAGINEGVSVTKTVGGRRSSKVYYKWQLVSTHTARRTFATLAILGGVADRLVMKMTGHKSEPAFRQYLRMEAEEVAVLLASHDYFKPQLKEVN